MFIYKRLHGLFLLAIFVFSTAAFGSEKPNILKRGTIEVIQSGGSFAEGNIAASSAGAVAFAENLWPGKPHSIVGLNDGRYGNSSSWIGSRDGSFAGVRFAKPAEISAIAFGRDNTGRFGDRCLGRYTIQYSKADRPDENTPDSQWTTIATIDYGADPPADAARRHVFGFPKFKATGVRIIVTKDPESAEHLLAIDELEIYGHGTKFSAKVSSSKLAWKNPLSKKGRLGSPLVEVTPFVFNGRLYLLENNQKFFDLPGTKPGTRFMEDEVRIRDVKTGKLVSVAMTGHAFGTALVVDGRVYVFAGEHEKDKPWRRITKINMTSSTDLKNWTKPVTVIESERGEVLFNTAVCPSLEKGKFVLLYETNDSHWPAFTFKYCVSDDLVHWKQIPGAVYGKDKYVGGPAIYREGDYYYTLYLQGIPGGYETRVTRSKDLVDWEDAPLGRPFVAANRNHKNIPLIDPKVRESNASDAELCYLDGKTIVYFTGSDQTTAGDLQWAEFEGTPRELLESFFASVDSSTTPIENQATSEDDTTAPKHDGAWTPVLVAAEDMTKPMAVVAADSADVLPSRQQLSYQNDQLGAFVHFGPATYINSDMLSTPPAEIFNPEKLDAEQWVLAAKSFGAKHIVLTAKHHNGFCLWPTKTTDYCVRNCPWKGGRGDVVGALAAACKKHDLKLGLYISAGDKHFPCFATPDPQGKRKIVGNVEAYFPVFMKQLEELLTNYGPLTVVWFDGAYDSFGWDVKDPKTGKPLGTAHGDAIVALVRKLQPQAAIFGGTKPDMRWSGSESGWAPYPIWNVVPKGQGLKHWIPPTDHGWRGSEANFHTRSTWFWIPKSDHTLADISRLMTGYRQSIGRGANLLINMTPDTSGRIPQMEVDRLAAFGRELKHTFGNPVAKTDGNAGWTSPGVLELKLEKPMAISNLVIEEEIAKGQHILEYSVDTLSGGRWRNVARGKSIGRKRIHLLDGKTIEKIRLRVTKANGDATIRTMAVYAAAEK